MPVTLIDKDFMELVTPRHNSTNLENDLNKFAERYRIFLENDMVISITDNPLSNLSYMGTEMIEALELPVNPEKLVLHLNTFHRKTGEKYDPAREQNEQDFDILLQHAAKLGVQYLLCVSGDGSERLPRLKPEDLGYDPRHTKTITSVQLLEYIGKEYPGVFTMGAAFNHYEPFREEMEKLERKLSAGAVFIITQPVVLKESGDRRLAAANDNLRRMIRFADTHGVQVVLEAWMSVKFAYLIPECIGFDIDFSNFAPYDNLKSIHDAYPEHKIYYSMVFTAEKIKKAQALTGRVVSASDCS